MKHLVLGCGYLGHRVARIWRTSGHDVVVVTRRKSRAEELAALGLRCFVGDATRAEFLGRLPRANRVLIATPADTATQILRAIALTASESHAVERMILISTTGVYGDAEGAWVDEGTTPAPTRRAATAALAAEQAIASSQIASHSAILRMAGIYGPGRVPFLSQLRDGDPIPAAEQGWLNLIHVDDAATIVAAVEENLQAGIGEGIPLLLNVTDGHPVKRGEFYEQISRLLGARPPQFVPPGAQTPRAERAKVSRRVSSERMRKALAVSLRYGSFRDGLAAILAT